MQGLPPQRQVNANDTDFESYTAAARRAVRERRLLPERHDRRISRRWGFRSSTAGTSRTSDIGGPPVALVNETLAKTFFRDQNPLGRRLKPGFGAQLPWFTIVGVVRDVKQGGVAQKTGTEIYFLADQGPRVVNFAPRNMNIVIRSAMPFDTLAADVRRVVGGMDPTLPLVKLRTMDDVFAETIARPRFLAELLDDCRGPGAGAGGHRHLRHPVVFGEPAPQGDWHSHGDGRHAAARAAAWCSVRACCSPPSAWSSASVRRSC